MKEVFIFVAGATPQIITETIYALCQRIPPVIPDEIFVLTTKTGKDVIVESLIKSGILEDMAKEYELPPIPLTEDSILVVKDENGNELYDIRNEKDNEIAGDLITEFIKEKTRDPQTRLHCSLAGGRKTMGFYLGSALQLFGRPWDKLYHVLVTPEFESNLEFFYKPRFPKTIQVLAPDGSKRFISTDTAQIELAELPFIRLADKLSLTGKRFRDLISEGQREIDLSYIQKEIVLNVSRREMRIGERSIKLVPVHFLVYLALLKRKAQGCIYPERPYCLDCTDCYLTVADFAKEKILEDMSREYSRIYDGKPWKGDELLIKWKKGSIFDQIRQYITKANQAIKSSLGDSPLLPFYKISSIRQYGSTRYGIRIERRKIKIK